MPIDPTTPKDTDKLSEHASHIREVKANLISTEESVGGLVVQAEAAEANAQTHATKAEQWAEELTDVEVEPNKYSAKHHAEKAELSAAAVNIPTDLTNQAHKYISVKADETGYEFGEAAVPPPQFGITARMNRDDFSGTTPRAGWVYLHGFDNGGNIADVDGFILHNGNKIYIPRSTRIRLGDEGSPRKGFLLLDTTFSNSFVFYDGGMPIDTNVVFVTREFIVDAYHWVYWNNNDQWDTFTPAETMLLIGTFYNDGTNQTLNDATIWTHGESLDGLTAKLLDETLSPKNNLSEIHSPQVARTNLGLGTVAVKNTGTAAGNVPLLESVGGNAWIPQSIPVGLPFPLFTNLTGVSAPDNSGDAKYILLTAGQSGAGGYNEGLLTNESVSGSAPLVEATAEIATGPLAGQVIPLMNTEESFLRARETAGALQFDQIQRIQGSFAATIESGNPLNIFNAAGLSGVFRRDAIADSRTVQGGAVGAGATLGSTIKFDPAYHSDARTSSYADGETRSKNRSATYYMRIQ